MSILLLWVVAIFISNGPISIHIVLKRPGSLDLDNIAPQKPLKNAPDLFLKQPT
jgi:hypothetical protein